ncbi:MAG: hypothetical protein CV087_02290 [Candidatus Brocadia sp. WS118]|nr:MAG: hypothetical protein CV087_02290 [Candidatus Brocadia sp. WS118]
MQVHNKLGYGFLEYENALMALFRREGIKAKQQAPVTVYFEKEVVGEYYTDILFVLIRVDSWLNKFK